MSDSPEYNHPERASRRASYHFLEVAADQTGRILKEELSKRSQG